MNNTNPQVQKIIYQTQCTYLYWYVFLNFLAINDIFLCWDGKQFQLFHYNGERLTLLILDEKKEQEPEEQKDAAWTGGKDLQSVSEDAFKELPLSDIIVDHQDLNPSKKNKQDIIPLKKKKVGRFPITTANKKSSKQPEKSEPWFDIEKYKSPLKKLVAFFKKSRDEWKRKCLEAKEELKLAKKNNKNLRESKKILKEKVKCLEADISKLRSAKEVLEQEVHELQKTVDSIVDNAQALNVVPQRHQYPIGVIYMYISLVLTASTSLRGASKALEVFISTLNLDCSVPSWPCGRLWLLRLGYYKLTRPKEKADDWIYVADHFIQLDDKKCFVILGIHQSQLLNLDRALTFEDMEPLAILPVNESNGTIVFEQLEQTIEKTGVPRAIVGDHGSDLKKGIDEFCNKHSQTVYIHDIKHKTALILKHELETDKDWQEFNRLRSETKQKVQQTSLAPLYSKKQRTKSRYMNVDDSIEWGVYILDFVEKQAKTPCEEFDKKMVEEKLGWIRNYKELLKEWSTILTLVSITEQSVRINGIRTDSYSSVKKALLPISNTSKRVKRIRKELLDFVKLISLKVSLKEKLLGSSEIIESIFGKLKEVEKEQSKSGITGLVLALAAMVSTTSMDVLVKALESVPVKKVMDWCEEHIGETVQSKRKKFLKGYKRKKFPEGYKKKEQKRGKLLLPI
jgi:hypothetical protein